MSHSVLGVQAVSRPASSPFVPAGRSTARLIATLSLVLAGCGPQQLSLADYLAHREGTTLRVRPGSISLARTGTWRYDEPCPAIADDVALTVNGEPVAFAWRGGEIFHSAAFGASSGGPECRAPYADLTLFETEGAAGPLRPFETERLEIVVSDGKTSVKGLYEHLSNRFELRLPEQQILARGSELAWELRTPFGTRPAFTLEGVHVLVAQSVKDQPDTWSLLPYTLGTSLRIMPLFQDLKGRSLGQTVDVNLLGSYLFPASECEGLTCASISVPLLVWVQAELER